MAKEIKKPGVRQVDISKDVSTRERDQIRSMTSDIRKIALRYHQIIAVFITMDVNGEFQIVHFGAGPEISKRSKYLADNIAKSIKPLIEAYDIPQIVDLPDSEVKA